MRIDFTSFTASGGGVVIFILWQQVVLTPPFWEVVCAHCSFCGTVKKLTRAKFRPTEQPLNYWWGWVVWPLLRRTYTLKVFFTFSLKVENPFKAVTHRLEKMFYELNYVFKKALHHSFIKLYIVGVKALIVRGGVGWHNTPRNYILFLYVMFFPFVCVIICLL